MPLCFLAHSMSVPRWDYIVFLHVGLWNLVPALCVLSVSHSVVPGMSGMSVSHSVCLRCVCPGLVVGPREPAIRLHVGRCGGVLWQLDQ